MTSEEKKAIDLVRKHLGDVKLTNKDILDAISVNLADGVESVLEDPSAAAQVARHAKDMKQMSKVYKYYDKLKEDHYKNWKMEEQLDYEMLHVFDYFEKYFKKADDHEKIKILEHIFRYRQTLKYMQSLLFEYPDEYYETLEIVYTDHWLYDLEQKKKKLKEDDDKEWGELINRYNQENKNESSKKNKGK